MKSVITALLLTVVGSAAIAQERWPISVELTAGHGIGRTAGQYRGDGSGLALDALLAYRITPGAGQGVVVALTSGGQGAGSYSLVCVPAEGGGCMPHFPSFVSAAVLAGYESGTSWTLRGLLGPSYVRADESAVGFQGRVDGAVPLVWRFSLGVSARALLIPSYRGDAFQLYAFSVGVRIR